MSGQFLNRIWHFLDRQSNARLLASITLMLRKVFCLVTILFATTSFAAETNKASETKSFAEPEAAYRETIEKRVADIVASLDLNDAAKSTQVHDILVAQYRTLRDWHDANDATRKAAKGEDLEQIKASLRLIHENFLAKLATELKLEQVEKIKDKMTYGKVQFTYTGYLNLYPNLADTHKQKILELLKEAREEAMDGGSSEEKTAIFNRYKGKINNYLSAQDVSDPKKKKPTATNSTSH
jgi:hypothetical protein